MGVITWVRKKTLTQKTLSTRKYRAIDVANSLGISWYMVDKYTKNRVFPCDRFVVSGKVARLYSVDECRKYYSYFQSLMDAGVPRNTAYINVVSLQLRDGVMNCTPIKGAKVLKNLPAVHSAIDFMGEADPVSHEVVIKSEEKSKEIYFIIAYLLLALISLCLGFVLLFLK